jgi:uncharacterized membrane protein
MRSTLQVTLASTAVAFATSLAAYPRLPERIPVHFDFAGNPNGFASRWPGAFVLPAAMLVLVGIDLARRGANAAIGTTMALLSAFFLVLHVLSLRAALTTARLGGAVWFVTGVAFVGLGLVMPRVRRNRWVGVRTRWAMSSPEAWARSQRAGGYTLAVAGVLFVLSSASNGIAAQALRALAILGTLIVPIVYSYLAARASS